MARSARLTRRGFLKGAAAAAMAAPYFVPDTAFGANDQFTMGSIGVGGRGRGDTKTFLHFKELRVRAVCDVDRKHTQMAKKMVDDRYKNTDCAEYTDFREITRRDDIDAIFIGTPDHWHAVISIDAMKHGKDVYCEKPETLTVREGRVMADTARRFGRVFSGGSQRVWGDYNWFHKMVRGGRIGEPKEAFVSVGGPSGPCDLPAMPVPKGMDWDMWIGPAPWRPYHKTLHPFRWRSFRDYSGGGMTDWGCHTFGGALFTLGLHETGPVEIIPPDGKDVKLLTYIFKNGMRVYHKGGWSRLCYRGTEGECPRRGAGKRKEDPPSIHIPNHKGHGGIFGDFVHCVKTRQRPFRDIEIAHRTATHCHLGNIAYWLKRPLKWDPDTEEILGDPEAARWLSRPKREPWTI